MFFAVTDKLTPPFVVDIIGTLGNGNAERNGNKNHPRYMHLSVGPDQFQTNPRGSDAAKQDYPVLLLL